MAGKLLNSCYFYEVLAHIPAVGLCTNQGAWILLHPWFGGVRLNIISPFQSSAAWEGWKLQPLQLLGTGIKRFSGPWCSPTKKEWRSSCLWGFIPSSLPVTCLRRCHKSLLKHSPHAISWSRSFSTKRWDWQSVGSWRWFSAGAACVFIE